MAAAAADRLRSGQRSGCGLRGPLGLLTDPATSQSNRTAGAQC
jgi:hypothetical protein